MTATGRHRRHRSPRRTWRDAIRAWMATYNNAVSDAYGIPPAAPPRPPVLRAHESMSMSRAALLEGPAALHAKEWGP